jgi:transcription termination/antitermination protein NusA
VQSHQQGVNAKGACIGPVGSRVRNVMAELHGEKIDIVDFSENPAEFVANALSPARVTRVDIVDPAAMEARVVVPDYQLSLAIGKEGQNARLAARLTGWRIDIRSDAAADEAASDASGASGSPGASGAPGAPAAGEASPGPGGGGSGGGGEARSVPPRAARSVPRQGREAARDAGAGKVGGNAGTAPTS